MRRDPPCPDAERLRQVGRVQWRRELAAYQRAIEEAEDAAPDSLGGCDTNLKRDLIVWADAMIRAAGITPGPRPADCVGALEQPSRVVGRIANRLDLAPPRGRGRPRKKIGVGDTEL